MHVTIEAFLWGFASALTLPLGALVSFYWTPGPAIRSGLMSFGAGALLFALAIDLFGDAVYDQYPDISTPVRVMLAVGAVLGGIIFEFGNRMLNNQGSFMRSLSSMRSHFRLLRHMFAVRTLRALGKLRMLKGVPKSALAELLPFLIFDSYKAGDELFTRIDLHTPYIFILTGKVHVSSPAYGEVDAGENDLLGDLKHHLTPEEHPEGVPARAVAVTDTTVVKIGRQDFDRIIETNPTLRRASSTGTFGLQRVKDVLVHVDKTHLESDHESEHGSENGSSDNLSDAAIVDMERGPSQVTEPLLVAGKDQCMELPMTERGLEKAAQSQANKSPAMAAAMAIWLGIAIDGVPESLTIGMEVATHPSIPLSLIFGVFASNFPEALANSIAMRVNGMTKFRTLWMWMSIALMTGIGASLGALMFADVGTGALLAFVNLIRGIAAGSMLTMISRSLLPEASVFHQGVVGLTTLAGFVVSYVITITTQTRDV